MLKVSQYGTVSGEQSERPPWVGVFRDEDTGDPPSDLYALVEPALPGSEEFCPDLLEAVGRVFHRRKASLTGGLLRALQSAHEDLRDWNRKSLKDHRVAAGISCLAVRPDHEAYIAQVAPATLIFSRKGSLLAFEPRIPEAVEPLGLQESFWPEFNHLRLEYGDRVVLLSPALAAAINPDRLAEAITLPPEEALPALYRDRPPIENSSALLISVIPDSP